MTMNIIIPVETRRTHRRNEHDVFDTSLIMRVEHTEEMNTMCLTRLFFGQQTT